MRAIVIAAHALAKHAAITRNDDLPKLRLPCSSQYARTEQPPLDNRVKGYQLLWLQIVEICDRFLGMRGGRKDEPFIILQYLEPGRNVACMILSRFHLGRDPEIGAQKNRAKFGHELFAGALRLVLGVTR